jgi:aromatic ring-cleaving dioxygenase
MIKRIGNLLHIKQEKHTLYGAWMMLWHSKLSILIYDRLNAPQSDALRALVNVARNEQIKSVDKLKRKVISLGHHPDDVTVAVKYWTKWVRK